MTLTARQLNRTTLARQLLLARETISAVEAVRRVVALQAQEAPSPYLALWNRVTDFDPVELDVASGGGAAVVICSGSRSRVSAPENATAFRPARCDAR